MSLLVKEKEFYRSLAAIALPIAAQNLINFGVSMADTVMLGMLGEVQLSAASIANQLNFVYMLFTFGTAGGCNVMMAQYWGKGEVEPMHKVMTMMYRLLLLGAAVFTTLALFFPRQVMSIFTTDQAVIAEGVKFLKIVGYSYFLSGVTTATVMVLRAVGTVRIAVIVYLSSLVTNVVLNYVLIFGRLGFPALGVRGAAWATVIARIVEFTVMLWFMIRHEDRIRYHVSYFFERKLGIAREFFHTAGPVVFNELLWGSGVAMIAVIIGRMGTEFTAANSICTVLSQFVTIVISGIGNGSAIVVGNKVGEGDQDMVRRYARTFVVIAVPLGAISACVVMLLKGPLLSLYNVSDLAKLYASQIMTVHIAVVFFQSIAHISLVGVLRGGGDTRFVLLADVIFMWCISIPLGYVAGLRLGLPVWVVYSIIKSDEVLKSIVALSRLKWGNWINDITTK